jgi:hypothetical protein
MRAFSVLQAVRAAPATRAPARLASVLRLYSTATPVLDYEAQLRGFLDKAARNVEAGIRAPAGEDKSLRLIMVAKPGGECSAGVADGSGQGHTELSVSTRRVSRSQLTPASSRSTTSTSSRRATCCGTRSAPGASWARGLRRLSRRAVSRPARKQRKLGGTCVLGEDGRAFCSKVAVEREAGVGVAE